MPLLNDAHMGLSGAPLQRRCAGVVVATAGVTAASVGAATPPP